MSSVISATSPAEGLSTPAVAAPPVRADRIIELVAVILLGITTVGTAWCGFQASQWSGASTDLARQASDQQVEGARLFGLATQQVAYDSTTVAQYSAAVASGNTELANFYRSTLVRPEFVPVFNRWEAELRAGRQPTPLSEDQEYLATQLADYQKSIEIAQQQSRESQVAGENSSAYVSVTILLAVALFFAGVNSSFKYRPARVLLLSAALATLAFAASRLADLPVMLL
jgi:hypothetical protein